MRFDWPLALVALVILPAAAIAYLVVERRRARFAVKFTNVEILAALLPPGGTAPWRRFIPVGLFALAVALAVVGIARPAMSRTVSRQQATIILVVDTSGSMVANDVEPTRLGAAQRALRTFLKKLPGRFQVGMVTFSSQPRIAVPVTDDHDLVAQSIDHMNPFGGTAIGDAIARALDMIRRPAGASLGVPLGPPQAGERVAPSAVVLLSDGAQNRGKLQALTAAAWAKRLKVPVYTVALGTPTGTIRISEGSFSETISVPPDPRTLRQIALETNAQSYAVASGGKLNAVYKALASRLSSRREYHEATDLFLGVSALLLLGAGAASFFFSPRIP